MRLFHFSEDPTIERFVLRPSKSSHHKVQNLVVWAVTDEQQWAYLVPRQCPRVTFYAARDTTFDDVETYLLGERDKRVIVIESAWLERCLSTPLFRYEFKTDNF
jgi:hypothetical protein